MDCLKINVYFTNGFIQKDVECIFTHNRLCLFRLFKQGESNGLINLVYNDGIEIPIDSRMSFIKEFFPEIEMDVYVLDLLSLESSNVSSEDYYVDLDTCNRILATKHKQISYTIGYSGEGSLRRLYYSFKDPSIVSEIEDCFYVNRYTDSYTTLRLVEYLFNPILEHISGILSVSPMIIHNVSLKLSKNRILSCM